MFFAAKETLKVFESHLGQDRGPRVIK